MSDKRNGEHFKADINLPLEERGGEGELPDEDDPSSSVDWVAVHELSVLCPMIFCHPSDGDLDRIYTQCSEGCPLQGRVLS